MVTTDSTGRQVEVTKNYYYAPGLLRKGLVQYSFDVGIPRERYGTSSFDYDNVIFGAGSARYGLTNLTTVEGHWEGTSDGLFNGGVGIVQTIGAIASVTASVSGSRYSGERGAKLYLMGDTIVAGVRLYASAERTYGTYFDLGRVAGQRSLRDYQARPETGYEDIIALTSNTRSSDRVGLSFTPWFDSTSVSLNYNRLSSGGETIRTADLSLSRSLGSGVSLYVNGFADLEDRRKYGAFATLGFRFGKNNYASASVENSGGRLGYSVQMTGATTQAQDSLGWGVSRRQSEGSDAQHSASLNYRAPFSALRAQIDESGGHFRGSAAMEGSLVMAGGGVFAANRIGQAFAVVKNAGAGTDVWQGGVRMATADSRGRALLPDLLPYLETEISIDPATLKEGWEPEQTGIVSAAGYRQATVVDFGARRVFGAVLVIHDQDGKPLEAGIVVHLEGGESAIMGYDGQVYLRDLKASNRIFIDFGAKGTCSLSFAYDVDGPAQPQIGPLTCP